MLPTTGVSTLTTSFSCERHQPECARYMLRSLRSLLDRLLELLFSSKHDTMVASRTGSFNKELGAFMPTPIGNMLLEAMQRRKMLRQLYKGIKSEHDPRRGQVKRYASQTRKACSLCHVLCRALSCLLDLLHAVQARVVISCSASSNAQVVTKKSCDTKLDQIMWNTIY